MSQQQYQHQQASSPPIAPIALTTTVHAGAQGISLPKIGTLIPNRIFVGGINSNTTEDELRGFFSVFGPIKDVKVIYDKSGLSKGSYGFVTFEDQETAESIIKNEAETLIFKDRKLNVGYAVRKQHILPKQEIGSTLLLAHNACPITNGLQVVQLCPHEHSFVAMNQSTMYYPTAFMVSPTVGSHEYCTLLTGAMNTPTQAVPTGKPGTGPLPVKGLICAHTIPVHPTATLGCPLVTSPNRPVQPACWHPESSIVLEKPKTTGTPGVDLNHPRPIPNEPNNEFSLTQNNPPSMIQQTAFIRSTVSTEPTGSWVEPHGRSVVVQQDPIRPTINNSVGLSPSQYNSTDPLSHVLYIPGKELRACPSQPISHTDSNATPIQGHRSFAGNLANTGCSGINANLACAAPSNVTAMIDPQMTRVASTNGTNGATRRIVQPGGVFNPTTSSFLADPTSFGSGIPMTGDNGGSRATQSIENKYESLFSNNKERLGLWPNGLQPPSRREDTVSIKHIPSYPGLEVNGQNTVNLSHNCLEQFLRQSRWPTTQTERLDEPTTDASFTSRGSLRQPGQTPNRLANVTDRYPRLCAMEETVERDSNNLGLPDDHEQCIRRLLIEKLLLDRAEPLDISNRTIPAEQHNTTACFRQTNRLVNIVRDEGRNETTLCDSSPHRSSGNNLPELDGFNCSQSLPTLLVRKDPLTEALPKRVVYDDDNQRGTVSNHFLDPGATVNSVTVSGPSPKKFENSDAIVNQEPNSPTGHLIPSPEIRTMSVQKLESSAMNPNALATTACGDISKQRPV